MTNAQDPVGAAAAARPVRGVPPLREHGMPPLVLMTTFAFAGFAVMLPVAPMHMVAVGGGTFLSGLVNAALMGATILTQVGVERARAVLGWRVSLMLACLLLGAPALLEIVANAPWQIIALAAVRGIGFGIITVSGSSALAALFPPERRGRAIGEYGLAVAGAQLVLTPAAPWIADTAGFPIALAVAGLPLVGIPFALSAGGAIEQHTRGAVPAPAPAAGSNGEAETNRHALMRLWAPILALVVVTCAGGAITTFAPQFVPGTTLTVVSLLVYTAAAMLARWLSGGLADRYGARRFVLPGLGLAVLGLAAIAASIAGVTGPVAPVVLVAGAILVGSSFGTMQNVTLVRSFELAGEHAKGVASTAWNVAFDAGTGVGALAIGALASRTSFSFSFLMLMVLSLAAAAVLLANGRRAKRPPALAETAA
ncbi:MFS transporter [Microbacterium sp. ASV81]|uniref:MFS transporter n=1 Tax=Microbacterium capsulatum TaxID=3041921 RepID=A0ABU0XCQ4_9MICO|nr:MFS transporter [Microbacterium sp. ASV81]MDQ4212896.1 MFS transporter [Microbacterium sp. ASV81]